jgi:Domain of unknown function (DUF5916)
MNHKTNLSLAGVLLLTLFVNAQTVSRKELPAKRTTQAVKIDGLLTDSAWKDAALMTDLVEFRPKMGAVEAHDVRTESYIMYNDEGIFFGGYCYERTKDSITRELSGRDGFGANDYIGIIFDTYFDKLNGFEYFVTPLNEQWDAKMSPGGNNGGEDFTWNAVWQSGAVIHEDGWSFEMFIPYSAIRFGKKDIQNWGLNITRRRRKTEQQSTWNPIDINVNGFLTQEGLWTGITNIKPPLRLQFSPYFSTYLNHYPYNKPGIENTTTSFNGGMDVKYGINQAFTLDVTLIPDFGQVQSDNHVLNLTPFEVKYNENRPFFTEGTELFNKGNLFYSRRIGGTPIHKDDVYNNIGSDQTVIENPTESKLINASKISGRTQKGLGIGVLNAITKPQYATIEDVNTKENWKYETNPLTNYNIFVLNQSMKHNSSVSLVNTNVWRSGPDYDANVTAALFDFNNKKNMWNVGGKAAVSNLVGYEANGNTKTGYNQQLYLGKISGRFNFNIYQELTDTKFSSNDLGYFTNNNFLDHGAWVGYRWTQPKGWYNRISINFNTNISQLFTRIGSIDEKFQRANFNFNGQVQTKKLLWFGTFWNYTLKQNDFYEPRNTGWFFQRGTSLSGGGWFETNGAKKYSAYFEGSARKYFNFYDQLSVDLVYNQNYRFSKKFSLSYRLSYSPGFNNMGYTTSDPSQIIFGKRKVNTVENILGAKYNFNNMMGITLRIRHYYSSVDNKEFFTLQQDGSLKPNTTFNDNANQNANFFNIDMVYTWQFAPGSFVNIVWKNAVYDYTDQVETRYLKNFGNTMDADANNNISLKVIYFLDYLQLKKKKTKN